MKYLFLVVIAGFSYNANAQYTGGIGIGMNPYAMEGFVCKYKNCKAFQGYGTANSCAPGMGGFGCLGPQDFAKVSKQETAVIVCKEKLEAKQKGAVEFSLRSLSKTERRENKDADKLAALSAQLLTKQMWAGCEFESAEKFVPMMMGSYEGGYGQGSSKEKKKSLDSGKSSDEGKNGIPDSLEKH